MSSSFAGDDDVEALSGSFNGLNLLDTMELDSTDIVLGDEMDVVEEYDDLMEEG
jgi:hypothetical protein